MPRVLITADWHLNATTAGSWSPDKGMNTTWWEANRMVGEIVDICNDRNVDYLVVMGDVFDNGRPQAEPVAMLNAQMARLESTGVFLLDGNHDQYGVQGRHRTPVEAYLSSQSWCSGYASTSRVVDLDGFQIAAVPWHRVAGTTALEATNSDLRDNVKRLADQITGPSILAGHLVLDGMQFGPGGVSFDDPARGSEAQMTASSLEASISRKELEAGPWSIARSGHIHKPGSIYVGSIFKVDFGERDETKHVELVDLDEDGSYTSEYVPLNCRELVEMDITATGKLPSNLVDTLRPEDILRVRYSRLEGLSSRAEKVIAALRDKGVMTTLVPVTDRTEKSAIRVDGANLAMNERDAMKMYLDHHYSDEPDTRKGVMDVFNNAASRVADTVDV